MTNCARQDLDYQKKTYATLGTVLLSVAVPCRPWTFETRRALFVGGRDILFHKSTVRGVTSPYHNNESTDLIAFRLSGWCRVSSIISYDDNNKGCTNDDNSNAKGGPDDDSVNDDESGNGGADNDDDHDTSDDNIDHNIGVSLPVDQWWMIRIWCTNSLDKWQSSFFSYNTDIPTIRKIGYYSITFNMITNWQYLLKRTLKERLAVEISYLWCMIRLASNITISATINENERYTVKKEVVQQGHLACGRSMHGHWLLRTIVGASVLPRNHETSSCGEGCSDIVGGMALYVACSNGRTDATELQWAFGEIVRDTFCNFESREIILSGDKGKFWLHEHW